MENINQDKPLTSKQLAELIFPAFAASNEATILSSDKRTIFYSEGNTVYAWIPEYEEEDLLPLKKIWSKSI